MVTEQELREAMADAVDDPAAETYTLGLSDRALAEAREGSRWWRPMAGRRAGAGMRWLPVVAVGSAFVVAAAVGVAALGGGDGSGGGSVSALAAPESPTNPVGLAGLAEFGAECFDGHGPKLDLTYVWDPATRQYHGISGDVQTAFYPSPDGKYALVEQGVPPQSWAVAGWSDAVAGRVTPQHPLTGLSGVHWTADGKELVTGLDWQAATTAGGPARQNQGADFYDPASGRLLASVPIPQTVLARDASRQWSIQEVQGDHASPVFPVLSADGDRLEYLNAQGATVRTLQVQDGLPASDGKESDVVESAQLSPDGRYLSETSASVLAVFDLQAGGKRIGRLDVSGHVFTGWIGDHQIVSGVEKNGPPSPSRGLLKTGHNPVYSVLSPELKVLQQAEFVLPSDPHGLCATWPISWAPANQFPGAFVP
jgi:hypothetical protein